jgi:NAD(P)-dependent dehydrogenase (short-subunit alcohol dehydrogenase family)
MPTVLVTGASRGLGREFCRQYADQGWQVIATMRDPDRASPFDCAGIERFRLDVGDRGRILELARELEGSAIDLLVNNAGLWAGDEEESFGAFSDEQWMEQLRVHVLGTMAMCEAFAPHVAASEKKLIVQISSGNGSLSREENPSYYLYNSTKAALNMITRGMAFDLRGRGVTVVALSPGYVATDMSGPDADLRPEESVSAMRALIERLEPADSGGFRRHSGAVYPW